MQPFASALIDVACRLSRSGRRYQRSPAESSGRSEHGARTIKSNSRFLLLSEKQNAAFDAEFHSQDELDSKFLLLGQLIKDGPLSVLDLGGGNGFFADRLLGHFPKSTVTILDISSDLLGKNCRSNQKELIHG